MDHVRLELCQKGLDPAHPAEGYPNVWVPGQRDGGQSPDPCAFNHCGYCLRARWGNDQDVVTARVQVLEDFQE